MIPNENNDTIVETSALSHDDLLDAYEKLAQKYSELKDQNDCLNQKLHHEICQKRGLENTLIDIQSELDSINDVNEKHLKRIEKKNEELKSKNQSLIMEKLGLENKIDELTSTIEKLNNDLKEVKGFLAVKAIKPRVSDTYAKSLEIENDQLRTTVNEIKEQLTDITMKYAETMSRAEDLTEKLECVQDNLQSKKAELEEKTETLEHLQEKVHELSTELTLLRSSSCQDDENRKGNSLFAEVDDQRQKMKRILQGERTHYLEMKKAYNAKEMEIRRLKRENLNIKSEIQLLNNQLKRGEQLSSNHTKIYITNLENDKQNLETQLKRMEERLADLANEQKMHWVESVLTSASKEARDLKDKNYVLLREKTSLADNHSKTLKELARARLDSIKLKVLLGRIVEDFKIKIDETNYYDLDIEEGVFDNLKVEEYEPYDQPNSFGNIEETTENEASGMLNESTIILLGGREKLGNAIPKIEEPVKPCDIEEKNQHVTVKLEQVTSYIEPANDFEIKTEDKENSSLATQYVPPIKEEAKPKVQSPLKCKSIQFAKTNDSKDGIKQSTELQKKPTFTVKRIVIPSKSSKTT